jgi:hypothetical protein
MAPFYKARRLWGKLPLLLRGILAYGALLSIFAFVHYYLRGPQDGQDGQVESPAIKRTPVRRAQKQANNESPEQRLAYLDASIEGQQVGEDNPSIERIRSLLESVSEQTGESLEDIAEQTAACTKAAREDHNKVITNLNLLEEASLLLDTSPGMSYREAADLIIKISLR